MKRDGHTHTHYCQHGSGEEAEKFILKAIQEGFHVYSITEHLPLPSLFVKKLPYNQDVISSLQIKPDDLDEYLREMHFLKRKYKDRIEIKVGFEVDYLPEFCDYTKELLREYGPYLDDALLSLHFLPGKEGWRCIDKDPEDFQEGLISYYSSFEEVQLAYYQKIGELLRADLGPYKPRRIGHLTLCNKFKKCFAPQGVADRVKESALSVLGLISKQRYSLDCNMAGLYKPHCGEPYPTPWIIGVSRQLGIELVYGSDAHSVADVGRGYDTFKSLETGSLRQR